MSIPIDLREWQNASSSTHKQLANALLPEDNATQTLIDTLSLSGKLTITQLRRGITLETASHVGRIAVGNLDITIHPKIQMLHLLHLLQYTYGLRQLDLFSSVAFDAEPLSFQDLLITQLLAEAKELLMRGLHRRYIRREEALTSPRGRIAIQTIARQGGIFQASLPCIHYPRLEDCLINQVLFSGLRLASQLANDELLRTDVQRLAAQLAPDITPIKLEAHTLKRLHREMDRLTKAYTPAITIIEMLLASQGISIDEDQQQVRLPGFLFDMNLFFQNLLSRFLREHLPEYDVQDQYWIRGTMRYVADYNPNRSGNPELRPDYIIKKGSRIVAILDAKYRDLWSKTLPPAMLYQLVMYALSHDSCDRATILYPTTAPEAREARIEVRFPLHGKERAYVILRPVRLLELEKLLSERGTAHNEKSRIELAEKLAFGEG
jgi:5-methylcytosine-specific restriction enzyme subunit McrC